MLILLFLFHIVTSAVVSRNQDQDVTQKYTVQMVGYSPTQHDDYVAVSRKAIPGYIVGFEPMANADRVHHMILYGCKTPAGEGFWQGHQTCGGGGSYILYAWARNAPNLALPKDVAFMIGHETDGIQYFVLQVHYAQPFAGNVKDFSGVTLHISQKAPLYLAAVLLFVSGETIPAHKAQHQNNVSCEFTSDTELHPFAFRTHTHAMGRVVSAYNKHQNQWTKLGSRNPQWPQLFESITTAPVITKGDLMAASCRFDAHDKDTPTPMGAMGTNEMCNFYMMFYWDAKKPDPYPYGAVCGSLERQNELVDYPKEGFELLPPRPELEHHAHASTSPFGVVEEAAVSQIGNLKLGQVAGLSFDNSGNLIVFHRANRVWAAGTFDQYNVLLDKTPIDEDVILIVEFKGNQSKVLQKMGKGKFYLPHGIHMDKEGFLYTTDVGSHTVAKWKIENNGLVQVWEHGERLMPDVDRTHFCKPAGIVRAGDHIYVADGYCNSRIVELSLDGKRTNEFGLPGQGPVQFQLPHDIVVNSQGHLLVADRENGRVQELSKQGDFISEWTSSLFSNIYSMDVYEDSVFMVPGRVSDFNVNGAQRNIDVYVGRAGTGLVEYAFGPSTRTFGAPHVIRVCPTGDHVFIGDIAEGKATIWKFKIQREGSMAAKDSMGSPSSFIIGSIRGANTTNNLMMFGLAVTVLVIAVMVLKRKRKQPTNGVFDRKGFKPLRTEETVEFISDASDSD